MGNDLLMRLVRFALRIFYRRVRYVDAERLPAERPILFVLNHPNALVDPLFVLDAVRRPVHFLAKAPLLSMPVLGRLMKRLGVLPVYRAADGDDTARNQETFEKCHAVLARGDCIAIFPEGTTHSDASLRPVKTGAARIALGAESVAGFGLGLAVVPVGLLYEAKQTFRSNATAWFGQPHSVADLREQYARDPIAAVHEETRRLGIGLYEVTLNVDRQETIDLIAQATDIFTAERDAEVPDAEAVVLRRQFSDAYAWLSGHMPGRIVRLRRAVARHRFMLAALGIRSSDLGARRQPSMLHVAKRALGVLPMLVLAAPGIVFEWVPYRLVHLVSTVASRGEVEVIATVKLIAAVLVYPSWWLITAVATGWWWRWEAGVAVLVLHPIAAYTAMTALERLETFRRTVRLLRLSANRGRAERLRSHERAIRQEMSSLADAYNRRA